MIIKENGTTNTKPKKALPDTVELIISALLAWIGCYLFSMRLGVISAYPLIILTTIPAAVFCRRFIKTAFFYALFGLMLPLTDSRTMFESVLTCIVCVLILSMSYLAIYLFKKQNKKAICRAIASVLLLSTVVIHVYINSNPFTFSKNSAKLQEYIDSHYKTEDMNSSGIYYDFSKNIFMLESAYSKRPTEKSLIYISDGKIYDEYIDLTESFKLEEQTMELTEKLRKAFPNDKFSVTPGSILNYPREQLVSAESAYDYAPYASFNIYFNSSLLQKDFIKMAEKYFDAIYKSGFKCYELVFYAGSAGKYYAKIETRFIPMKARFDDKILKANSF